MITVLLKDKRLDSFAGHGINRHERFDPTIPQPAPVVASRLPGQVLAIRRSDCLVSRRSFVILLGK